MAGNRDKRDPESHRTPNQMRDYARTYGATPEQVKNRVARNAARRELMKEGKVRKGDGVDVDHVQPLSKGGSNSRSNLRPMHRSANRGRKL
jgi:5-methylcytosine-specific restriction endonuclease McrA